MNTCYMLASTFCLFFCFVYTHTLPWPFTLILFSFVTLSFLFFLNFCLVPGGFAWRIHHENYPELHGTIGWPVLTLRQMGSLALRTLASIAASATVVMAFRVGARRVIISSRPDTAREILSGSTVQASNGQRHSEAGYLSALCGWILAVLRSWFSSIHLTFSTPVIKTAFWGFSIEFEVDVKVRVGANILRDA